MKISITQHTASTDDFLQDIGIPSNIAYLSSLLSRQTFQDFELIYCDRYYTQNKGKFPTTSFPITHVPLHPEHQYYAARGLSHIAAAKNTTLLHAKGELVVTIDDASYFDPSLLQQFWDAHQSGTYLHTLHRYPVSPDAARAIVEAQEGELYYEGYLDCRWNEMLGKKIRHTNGTWLWSGSSYLLDDALELNGYSELLDGHKTSEDVDFGNRLQRIGYQFSCNKDIYLTLLPHIVYEGIKSLPIDQMVYPFRKIIANKDPLSPQEIEYVKKQTDIFDEEDILLWQNTPLFDLKKQREQL